jgi:hypothetical protein
MICTYKLGLDKQCKNALILDSQLLLFSIIILLISVMPLVIVMLLPSMALVVYMLMFMFGFVFLGLVFTAFGQMAFDNITTPLYQASIMPEKKPASKKGATQKQNIKAAQNYKRRK